MKKKVLCLLLTCLTLNLSISWAQPPAQAKTHSTQPIEPVTPLNRIAAIVNDEIISESDLQLAIDQMKLQMTSSNVPLPPADKLRNDTLQQLITYRLLLQMATRNEIHPTTEEVDRAIELIAKSHNISTDQLKTQLVAQHLTYPEFRKKISEQLAINKLQQQMVGGQLKVTDNDIAAFKNSIPETQEYRLADFFLPLSQNATAPEKAKAFAIASDIQNKLNNGIDIDKIQPAYQDLGWRNKDNLPEIFTEQLKTLTPQKASPPLRAPNGYHVLKILETRNNRQNMTDEQIREIVLRQKYEVAVKEAVEKAQKQAYIQIIPQ